MWIMLNDAFLSIVAPRRGSPEERDGLLSVRARFTGDLERVFPGCAPVEWGGTDYRWRALVPREEAARAIATAIAGIGYTNFKDSVDERWRHDDYLAVWGSLARAQDREARIEAPRRRRRAAP